jgi:hypothetical protein
VFVSLEAAGQVLDETEDVGQGRTGLDLHAHVARELPHLDELEASSRRESRPSIAARSSAGSSAPSCAALHPEKAR